MLLVFFILYLCNRGPRHLPAAGYQQEHTLHMVEIALAIGEEDRIFMGTK